MALNHVELQGRLVREPDVRKVGAGISTLSSSIAVDRNFVDKETGKREADFIPIVAWRTTADFIGRYFSKGSPIIVEGKIQTRKYKDKNDVMQYVTEVLVDNAYFGGSKKDDSGKSMAGVPKNEPEYKPWPSDDSPTATPAESAPVDSFDDLADDDSELPF